MTEQSRTRFLTLIGVAVAIFVCAGMAIGGYYLGRNAAQPQAVETIAVVADAPDPTEAISAGGATPDEMTVPQPADTAASVEASPTESTALESSAAAATGDDQPEPPAEVDSQAEPLEPSEPVELEAEDLKLLIEVWDIISSDFDGPLPKENEVVYDAIRGSLELLDDQNTRFVPPDVAERARQQLEGSFEGIGAFVNTELSEQGYLVIVRPIEGQPADQAGLRSGDLVTHVDGQTVVGLSVDEIIGLVKGPKGTQVTLTILRETEPEPFDVTITRALIDIPIVTAELLDEDIAYVRLDRFSSNASEQLEASLAELLDENPVGIILDLRDNPGGLLNQAVAVSDLFMPEGVVLYERDGDNSERVFRSDSGDLGETLPLVVLVNVGSASASEIVAGAVQDLGRGVLVGEKTFGKGSVQSVNTLSDSSELRVTIARWYTPNRTSIDKEGISPDFEVPTPEEFGTENDTQLQRAIELILEG